MKRFTLLIFSFWVAPLLIHLPPGAIRPMGTYGSHVAVEAGHSGQSQAAHATDVVTLFVGARDKEGHPVRDLTSAEIRLQENGTNQGIDSFAPDEETPVLIGVLIDMSASRRDEETVQLERAALREFLGTGLRKGDAAYLAVFSDEPFLLSDVTNDQGSLDRAFDKLAQIHPHGATALYDSISALAVAIPPAWSGRRAFVILSDFDDNLSKRPREQATKDAQMAGTSLYCLVDLIPSRARSDIDAVRMRQRVAQELSQKTGGTALTIRSAKDLETGFAALRSDLQNVYALSYRSTKGSHDGKFHKLHLETSRKDVNLLALQAYYSPRE